MGKSPVAATLQTSSGLPDIAVVCAVSRNIELEVNFETRGAYLAAPNKIGVGDYSKKSPRSQSIRQTGSSALQIVVDLLGEFRVLFAALAATFLDLGQLFLGRLDIALLQVGLAHIFTHQRVFRIVPQRFLVIAEADGDAAGLAVRIAEIVEDARIGLVGRKAEYG